MKDVYISGRITKDIALTVGEYTVANFTIANNDGKKNGENGEFYDITAWNKTAERIRNLKKGKFVYIKGQLSTSSYVDKEGIKRKAVRIIAERIEYERPPAHSGQQPPAEDYAPDDIPEYGEFA